jgi:hypothetical protein
MIPDLLQNHTEEISKGFEETLQTYPSIFGLGMHLDNLTPDQRVKDPYTPRSDGKRFKVWKRD